MKKITSSLVLGLLMLSWAQSTRAQGRLQQMMWASYAAEANKDIVGAMKALKGVDAKGTEKYILNLRLGWLAYLAGMWNESVRHYQTAAKLSSNAIEPLQGMLLPLGAAGKTAEITKTHEAILRIDPNNYKSLSQLAWMNFQAKDYKKAAKYYSKIVRLYPTDVEMLLGYGYSLKFYGDKEEANDVFQQVLLLSPKNPRAIAGMK